MYSIDPNFLYISCKSTGNSDLYCTYISWTRKFHIFQYYNMCAQDLPDMFIFTLRCSGSCIRIRQIPPAQVTHMTCISLHIFDVHSPYLIIACFIFTYFGSWIVEKCGFGYANNPFHVSIIHILV